MILFAKNLKYLRELKKLKQADMLDSCGFKQSTWNGYERGFSTPNVADLIKISDFFKVSEADLLHVDLSEGNLNKNEDAAKSSIKGNLKGNPKGNLNYDYKDKNIPFSNVLREPESLYKKAQMPRIVTVNEHGIDNIIYVPIKAQAGYLSGYTDQEYIESLPSFRMPGLNNNTYRMFEVEGISMSPTLSDKDRVIAEWVTNFDEIRENRIHVIIHTEGVCIKRVLNRVNEREKLYLKSDTLTHRQDYPLLEIDPEHVKEIWYVRMKVSSDLREPSELYTRVTDLEINVHEIMKNLPKKK